MLRYYSRQMFVALNTKDGSRVTSIASEWADAEDVLREWARSDQLVCPGCEQKLWLKRMGKIRRRHFAHRSRSDCPLEAQEAEVLEIKAQLYEWLQSKPRYCGKVEMDMTVGAPGFDKRFDLVVRAEAGLTFAYWILDRQQPHYCDPPYVPLSRTANFTDYASGGFGLREQEDLARLAWEAAMRGATVVVSNHDTALTRKLYRRAARLVPLMVSRTISCNGANRKKAKELLAVFRRD